MDLRFPSWTGTCRRPRVGPAGRLVLGAGTRDRWERGPCARMDDVLLPAAFHIYSVSATNMTPAGCSYSCASAASTEWNQRGTGEAACVEWMPESAQGHPEALHAVWTFGHKVHMFGGVFQVAEHMCEVIAFCRLIGDAPQVTRTHDGGQR